MTAIIVAICKSHQERDIKTEYTYECQNILGINVFTENKNSGWGIQKDLSHSRVLTHKLKYFSRNFMYRSGPGNLFEKTSRT